MKRDFNTSLSWGQRFLLAGFTLLVVTLAVGIWWRSQNEALRNAQISFEGQVDKLASDLTMQIHTVKVILDGAAAFWQTTPLANRSQWEAYTSRLRPWNQTNGLNAVSFVQPVAHDDLQAFSEAMKSKLAEDFQVHGYQPYVHGGTPLTDQKDAFVVTHFEPYQRYRSALLGLDIGAEKTRRAALEAARDRGKMVLSDPVSLIITASNGVDFLAATPVYRSKFPLLTVEQRRAALLGWAVLGVHGPSLAQGVFSQARSEGYDISLYTLNAGQQRVEFLHASAGQGLDKDPGLLSWILHPSLSTTRTLILGGKTWGIEAYSTPQLERRLQGDRWGGLVVNLALAFALAAGLWLLLFSRQQSRLLATQALAELDERERHYRSVVEGTAEGYWQIDPLTRRTVEVNSSLCTMLGYSRDEMIGQSPAYFTAPSSQQILLEQMDALWTNKHSMCEITLLKKDGGAVMVYLAASALRAADGTVETVFGMLTDITEVVRMREALTEQARALEASNSDLKQFAYVASHDLQAPLRSVSSYLQLLERRYGDSLDGEAREFIDFAVAGAHRMAQLINDLLAFSRLENKAGQLKPVSVSRCLEQALRNLEVNIASANAEVDVPPSMPVILGDQGQLVSLFQNLIGNAIKYCPADRPPRVEISAQEHEDVLEVSVADNGIGIPQDQYERIFLIFQRLHGPGQYEGTGIGLALCKRIVDRHGGSISLAPNKNGQGGEQGTIFTVRLPMPRRIRPGEMLAEEASVVPPVS
jgi:PAS domain S-box-containing protein